MLMPPGAPMADGQYPQAPQPINPRLLLLHNLLGGGRPRQVIHGFGPGGNVTYSPTDGAFPGANPGGPMIPYTGITNALQPYPDGQFFHNAPAPTPQDTQANTNRPADLAHIEGNDPQAAQLWEQHHPGAMQRGQIPDWVQAQLFGNLGNVHINHVADAHERVSQLAQMIARQRQRGGVPKRSLRRFPGITPQAAAPPNPFQAV